MKTLQLLLAAAALNAHAQLELDSFNPAPGLTVYATVVQTDGKIVIGGDFTTLAPNGGATVTRRHIARLNPDGSVDESFNPNADARVLTLALQSDGKILAGGVFTTIGGQTRNHIARLDPSSGLADAFDPNANLDVNAIVVQPDGNILVGGNFTGLGPNGGTTVLRERIARVNEDGMLDSAFGLDIGANNAVFAIALHPNGTVMVGGLFTSINGKPRSNIAQLSPTSGAPTAFDVGAMTGPLFFSVNAIAVQTNGSVVAVGSFTGIHGETRNRIARFDSTTGALDSFNPNANNNLFSVAIQADGKILVGGGFSGANSIGGATRRGFVRLDPLTGAADSFDPNPNGPAYAIVPMADGRLLLGGAFTQFAANGGPTVTRKSMARFGPPAQPLLSIQQISSTNMVLSWPTNFTGYTLQANTDLNPGFWSGVTSTPAVKGTNNVVTNSAAAQARFFRLTKP